MAATRATAMTSPLGTPPDVIARSVSFCMRTAPEATATRAVSALSPTCTILASLLNGHALGEVARLIDIGALEIGHVIREQLHGQHGEQRLQQRRRVGHQDDLVGHATD